MVLLLICTIIALSIAIDTVRLGISPMPTSRKAREVLLSLVDQGTVYELGSGWGTLAAALSKKNRVCAFEMAWIPWIISVVQKRLRKAKKLSIERKDFFSENLSNADVVICYLYPGAMQKLGPKFERELKKGAIVLSNSFQLPGRKPDEIFEVGDWMKSTIYCYRFN
jgi:hypothetical protein